MKAVLMILGFWMVLFSISVKLEYGNLSVDYPDQMVMNLSVGYIGGVIDAPIGPVKVHLGVGSTLSGGTLFANTGVYFGAIGVGYMLDVPYAVDSPYFGIFGEAGDLSYRFSYVYPLSMDTSFSLKIGKFLRLGLGGFANFEESMRFRGFGSLGFNFLGLQLDLMGYFKFSSAGAGLGGFAFRFGYEDPKLYRALLYVNPETSKIRTFASLTVEDLKKSPIGFLVYKYDIFGKRPAVGMTIEYSYKILKEGEETIVREKTMVGADGRAILAYDPQSGLGEVRISFNTPPGGFVDFGSVEGDSMAERLLKTSEKSGMIGRKTIALNLQVSAVPNMLVVDEEGAAGEYYYDSKSKAVVLKRGGFVKSLKVKMKVVGLVGGAQKVVEVGGNVKIKARVYVFDTKKLTFENTSGLEVETGVVTKGEFDLTIRNLNLTGSKIAFVVMDYYETLAGKSVKSFSDLFIVVPNSRVLRDYVEYLRGRSRNLQYATLIVNSDIRINGEPIENYGSPMLNVLIEPRIRMREVFETAKGAVGKRFKLPYGIHRIAVKYSGIEDIEMVLKVDRNTKEVLLNITNDPGSCGNVIEEHETVVWSNSKLCGTVTSALKLTALARVRIKKLYLLSKVPGIVRVDGEFGFKRTGRGTYEVIRGYKDQVLSVPGNSGFAFEFASILERESSLIFKPKGSRTAYRLPFTGKYATDYSYYFIEEEHYTVPGDPDVPVELAIPMRWVGSYNRMKVYGVVSYGGNEYYVPIDTTITGQEGIKIELDGVTYKLDIPAVETSTESVGYSPLMMLYKDIPVTYYVVFYRREGGKITAESDPVKFSVRDAIDKGYYEKRGNVIYIDLEKVVGGFEKKEF